MEAADTIAPTIRLCRQPSVEDRREMIAAAADGLLGEAGLDGLTVRALLKRTGLARRAFYEGFASKDELVLAVFARVLKAATDHFTSEFARLGDPLACIRYFVHNITMGGYRLHDPATADRRSAALSREHMRLAESRPAELAMVLRPLIACLTDQVERGIRCGQLREADPEIQAKLIYNLMAATTQTELLKEEQTYDLTQREHLSEAIWQFCRHAIIA